MSIYEFLPYLPIIALGSGLYLVLKDEGWAGECLRRGQREICNTFERNKKKGSLYLKGLPLYRSREIEKIDREIYESLSYLRNIIMIHRGRINSDAVITGLAEREGPLKGVYARMLSLMRTGRSQEAEKLLAEACATETGREFAGILMSWEKMKPEQLTEIIISYQRNIKETCITRQRKKDEIISDFIYFPVVTNVFLIFINFIYVSYFMEQKEMFQMFF